MHKLQPSGVVAGNGGVGGLVAGFYNNADFFNAGAQRFFNNNTQHRFFGAVSVDEGLQGQGSLLFAGSGNYGFCYFHGGLQWFSQESKITTFGLRFLFRNFILPLFW